MKGLPFLFLATALTLAVSALGAQEFPAPIFKIEQEEVKFDKVYEHIKTEIPFVRAAEKRRGASHWLGLQAYSGRDAVWALIGESSFAGLEADERTIIDDPAALAENIHLHEADNRFLLGTSTMLAVFREDMSYRPKIDWPHMRYIFIRTYRIRPGQETKFEQSFKMYNDAHTKGNVDEQMLTYEVFFGAEPMYLQLYPMQHLGDIDQIPGKHGKRYEDALGKDGQEKIDALQSEAVAGEDTQLFSISPEMSFVPGEWKKTDPEFWAPKTGGAAAGGSNTGIAQESGGAVNAKNAATGKRADEELIRLEKEWAAAGPKGDIGFFERIAAEDYLIVDVDGSVRNKQEEIANFRKEKQTSQTVDDIHVRIYENTGVVVGRFTISGTLAGQPNNFAGRFTDVWLKRNGRWRIVSTQNTGLPEADTAKVPPDSFFVAMEKEDWEALKNKDKAAATRLLADDFVGMYDFGFFNKAEWIKQIDGQYKIDAYTIEDPKVLRPNPTTALLLYRSTCKGTGEWAEYCSHTQYISDLMVQRNGKWEDLFSQDTIAVPATSVSVSGSAKSEKVTKDEIEHLERLAWEAIKTKDKAALAGFSADDYFDFGSDGRVDKAKGLSEGWMGSDSTLSDFTFDDLQVKLFSDDIALITYRGTHRGTTRGKPDSGAGFYSDLYMKRNGKWLSVFTQDSNLKCAGL